MSELLGSRALVTGGSRGIGAAIAISLVQKGADVAISYERAADRAAEIVAKIEEMGRRAFAFQANSGDPSVNSELVEQTVGALGGLDILVNNAGTIRRGNIADLSLDDVDTILNVNIRGTVLTIRSAIKHMGSGSRVVTVGSTHGDHVPLAGGTMYALSKSAHHSFTKAARIGSIRRDSKSGGAWTDRHRTQSRRGGFGTLYPQLGASGPLRNIAEVADVVSFLAGRQAGFVTEPVVTVDGGMNA